MKVYQPKVVEHIREFYGMDLLANSKEIPLLKDYLFALAECLYQGVQEKKLFLFQEINNYHKDFLGQPKEALAKRTWTLEECQQTIANEYGFTNWGTIDGNILYDKVFEEALDFLLNGQLDNLKKCMEENPDLIYRKSRFGHQATLLHYVGSNGVEFWRQVVPLNLPEITKFLLEKGADKGAKMKVYGGEFSVIPLLGSSVHPYKAGIAEEMKTVLRS